MTIHVGLPLCKRGCQLLFDASPPKVSTSHLSLIFLFPFQASALTNMRLPGFKFTVPRPSSKHQIMCTVPGNCRLGGIVGMYYFSQMRWPVSFLVFSQLPDHPHNHLV